MIEGLFPTNLLVWLGAGFVVGVLFTTLIIRRIVINRATKALREAKEQFVALSSHYLLTPISIIQGAIARLQDSDSKLTTEDRRSLYENIQKGQQRLWILAEQFILANQINEGMLTLKTEAVSVLDIVTEAVSALDVFAREKHLALELRNSTNALQEVRVDRRRVKQALIAVIDNAVKFSPEETTIHVTITTGDGMFEVAIADNGGGMSGSAISQVTQAFGRGTSSYTFDHEGIGLGLYIANAIVREHGGELRINTTKAGTTVALRFPIT